MIAFTSALLTLRCHVVDLFPAGLLFLIFAYGLVIRAFFSDATRTLIDPSENATLNGETMVFNLVG